MMIVPKTSFYIHRCNWGPKGCMKFDLFIVKKLKMRIKRCILINRSRLFCNFILELHMLKLLYLMMEKEHKNKRKFVALIASNFFR